MKLSEATKEDKLQALAEMAGWTIKSRRCPHSGSVTEHYWFSPDNEIVPKVECSTQRMFPSGRICGHVCGEEVIKILPKFLESYDAIIPLIIQLKASGLVIDNPPYDFQGYVIDMTPSQMADALLLGKEKFTA